MAMTPRSDGHEPSPEQRRRSVRLALLLGGFAVAIYVAYILLFAANTGVGL